MPQQGTKEHAAITLTRFAIARLKAGETPETVEQDLIHLGAGVAVAKLLVGKAVSNATPVAVAAEDATHSQQDTNHFSPPQPAKRSKKKGK